jgi:hypothetical protein
MAWTSAIGGAVLAAIGATVSLLGGLVKDARGERMIGEEARQVLHGQVHPGRIPGDMIGDPAARREAVRSSELARDVLVSRRVTDRALARPCGALMVLMTAGMFILSGSLAGQTPAGHSNVVRDMGLATWLGLSGFRLLTVPGRHPIAAGGAAVAALLLVAQGVLARHSDGALVAIEVISGALGVAAGMVALLSPDRETTDRVPGPTAESPQLDDASPSLTTH